MEEGDAAVADAGARLLVDQPEAGLAHGAERRVDVVGRVGDVVEARAVPRDELADARVLGERPQQLHMAVADLEQHGLDALLLDGLPMLLAHVEGLRVELDGGVEVLDGDSDVVDAAEQHGRAVYDSGSTSRSEAAIDGTDVVVHCAARTGPWGPEREYRTTNVDALATLVSAARASGVRRIVHVSSITVHGNDIRGAGDETSPFRSEPNPYSRSKIAGELLLQRLVQQEGAPVTIVRPGVIYGPRDAASFARFATMIRDGRMVIFGSGRNHVPLVYAADVARGVLQAAESMAGRSNLNAASDLEVASRLAAAAARGAAANVIINLPSVGDDRYAGVTRAEITELLETVERLVAKVSQRVGAGTLRQPEA